MSSLSEEVTKYAAVIVTGGSSGIGKSFIELIATVHPGVLICNLSRRVPAINVSQLNLRHVPCDLSKHDEVSAGADAVLSLLTEHAPKGPVLLINNSGLGAYGVFPEPNLGHQLEMLDVNVRAVVEFTGRLLPCLKTRSGAVITVASTAAFQPTPYLAAYGASKAFVLHWSLALNEELRGTGVRTLAVCPGPTSTEFFRRAGLKKGSVADSLGQTTEQVVSEALQALARGKAQVVTGWKNKVMAAVASKFPKPFVSRISAKILARWRLSKVSS
ncbi:SDR family NAD(P)-dependent oxidoreductase [Rariglobus hedericola]|uniref:SDR family NAD(P)-dependent oxidoreductase n=1 Tax=Rariglobus hedericola TaxID=2597822 RepID=A0A556QNB0_9BACT|nr:SDR family NAD(P)-dependent oxidoreductase [Rariglobus hedericola]TSJ78123.1 SDR family NAD(P)-dependent oxidoreductase [Rariglobus hedericola]